MSAEKVVSDAVASGRVHLGTNAFSSFVHGLTAIVNTVKLCTDNTLLVERANAAADLDRLIDRKLEMERAGVADTAGSLGGEGSITTRIDRLNRRLDQLDAAIDEASTELEVTSPNEDAMLALEDLRKDDFQEWVVEVLALAFSQDKKAILELRKALTRASWTMLVDQVLNRTMAVSSTVPFSSTPSGGHRTS